MVNLQVNIQEHPCESNMFQGSCRMVWVMFVPPGCPKPVSELDLNTSEDFEHVSFGKVTAPGVMCCIVRDVWTVCRR
jgi:hypothetical protein